MKMIKTVIASLAIILLIAIAIISFGAWSFNSPAVDLGALNRIQVGMTKLQVQEILGEPDEETPAHNYPGSNWWYRKRFKWYALRIDFDENDKLLRYIHDD